MCWCVPCARVRLGLCGVSVCQSCRLPTRAAAKAPSRFVSWSHLTSPPSRALADMRLDALTTTASPHPHQPATPFPCSTVAGPPATCSTSTASARRTRCAPASGSSSSSRGGSAVARAVERRGARWATLVLLLPRFLRLLPRLLLLSHAEEEEMASTRCCTPCRRPRCGRRRRGVAT